MQYIKDEQLGLLPQLGGPNYCYLASPYSKYPEGLVPAFEEVCAATGWLYKKGVSVFSPIAHSHPVALYGGVDARDRDFWENVDFPFLYHASAFLQLTLPSWDISIGCAGEKGGARMKNAWGRMPMWYLAWPR